MCQCLFLINVKVEEETPTHAFSYEFWEIFKNLYFEEYLRTAPSNCSHLPSYPFPGFFELLYG